VKRQKEDKEMSNGRSASLGKAALKFEKLVVVEFFESGFINR